MADLFKELEETAKHFDWTYNMSDCHLTWERGDRAEKILRALVKQCEAVDEQRAISIILPYQGAGTISIY